MCIDPGFVRQRHVGIQIELVKIVIGILMAQDPDAVPAAAWLRGDGLQGGILQLAAWLISGPNNLTLFGFYISEHNLHCVHLSGRETALRLFALTQKRCRIEMAFGWVADQSVLDAVQRVAFCE